MRVAFNRISTLGRKSGVGHYADELLRCLQAQASPDTVVPYPAGFTWYFLRRSFYRDTARAKAPPPPPPPPEIYGPPRPRSRRITARIANRLRHEYIQARQRVREWMRDSYRNGMVRQCSSRNCDLFHDPNNLAPEMDAPYVVTLHDCSVLLFPEYHPEARVRDYEANWPRVQAEAKHFLAVSEFTRQEMVRCCGIAPEKITAVHNGVRRGLRVLSRNEIARTKKLLGLPEQYLLSVGTVEPRKNMLLVLKAYCSLPESVRQRCPLVIAGQWGWKAEPVEEYWWQTAKHAGVMRLDYLEDAHLPGLYNGAAALVYASHYEGFGLPPLEMRACGGAVLASDIDAHREVLGKGAEFIHPLDQDGWRTAMQRAIVDADWRRQLQAGGVEWASRFTWERCAAETLDVYRRVSGMTKDKSPKPADLAHAA